MSVYNKDYYTSNNYSSYLDRGKRYEKLVDELLALLESLSLITKTTSIIDFGCAVGFILKRLTDLGYQNNLGVDISDWAREECIKKHLRVEKYTPTQKFDVMFSLDVFEHITDTDITDTLNKTNPDILVVRIPVADKTNEDFYLEVSRKDKTHINCKTKEEWKLFLRALGFKTFLHLNISTIYDSLGVFSFIALK